MLTGAVLAGGKSRRFGRNKALEVFRGRRLLDWSLDALGRWCDQRLVVANDLTPYLDVDAAVVQDFVPEQGPLGGIHTALLYSRNDWVLVKGTDMPFLVPGVVDAMLELRENADVVTPMAGGYYEPLLALYHRSCVVHIANQLEKHHRQVVRFYGKVRVRTLDEEVWRSLDPEGVSFLNVNTPEDWEKLQWI